MKPVAVFACILCTFFGSNSSAQPYNLTVNIAGLRNSKGTLYISLYNSKEGYPKDAKKAFRLSYSAIAGGKCTIVLGGIPRGVYALACYHDENNNGKMDKNFFGSPKEGTGASNNAKGFMGPPSFSDAQFLVTGNTTQEIKINY